MSHLLAYLVHLRVQRPFEEPEPSDPPGASGQPQITNIDLLNGDAEITVEPPLVENAEWIEWFAGSNVEHWENGTSENPNISFTMNEIVFTAPRQPEENDNSFFCYRGANNTGTGPTTCNGFTIPGEDVEPGELGAPNIDSATPFQGFVRLSVTGGENADDHDVHREQGDQDFTAGPGNLIDQDIDQAPDTYDDTTVQPVTTYSYRLMAKKEGQTSVPSNRVSVTSLGQPVGGDDPNLPANFTDLLFQHDCSFWIPQGGGSVGATGFGVLAGAAGPNGNDGGVFTGSIESSRYVSSGSPGTPIVTHGPTAPHGKDFCFRTRYSRGSSGGLAEGNGASCSFLHPEQATGGTSAVGFRAIYIHYWFLFEGTEIMGERAIRRGASHRMQFQYNGCPNHDHGGVISAGVKQRVTQVGTTNCTGGNLPNDTWLTRFSPGVTFSGVPLNGTADRGGDPGTGALWNWLVGRRDWCVGNPGEASSPINQA